MDDKFKKDGVYKITFMGLNCTGKTSIINRLINNSFTKSYLQTFEKRNYFFEYSLTDDNDYVESNYNQASQIKFLLEDVFGLNNQLVETPEHLIQSQIIREKREIMLKQFQEIMHSISSQNDIKVREKPEFVERIAFVFVIDVNVGQSQFKQLISVIKTIYDAEKNFDRKTLKCLIINKIDLSLDCSEDKFSYYITKVTDDYACDIYYLSALSMENFRESLSKFLNKCYVKVKRQNVDIFSEELNSNEENRDEQLCNNTISCNRVQNVFTCGV